MLTYFKHTSIFKQPGGTSRGVLHTKDSWIVRIEEGEKIGFGEISIIPDLSLDDPAQIEHMLDNLKDASIAELKQTIIQLSGFPAVQFGLDCAIQDYNTDENQHILFPSSFTAGTKGIPINGLIWMGTQPEMTQQIENKLQQGFKCLKMKVGAIDFEKEIAILQNIRKAFSAAELELRLDANGAFSVDEAASKLDTLSQFDIHSIEQPIKPNQWQEMAQICRSSAIPIALDEELIGCKAKTNMLSTIAPQYIILKPSLLGGFIATEEWVELAKKHNINWWATSALETNIGLNAIAQWTATQNNAMPQGLGTGQVFTNNFNSPLFLEGEHLFYNTDVNWQLPLHLFETN